MGGSVFNYICSVLLACSSSWCWIWRRSTYWGRGRLLSSVCEKSDKHYLSGNLYLSKLIKKASFLGVFSTLRGGAEH